MTALPSRRSSRNRSASPAATKPLPPKPAAKQPPANLPAYPTAAQLQGLEDVAAVRWVIDRLRAIHDVCGLSADDIGRLPSLANSRAHVRMLHRMTLPLIAWEIERVPGGCVDEQVLELGDTTEKRRARRAEAFAAKPAARGAKAKPKRKPKTNPPRRGSEGARRTKR